MDTADKFMASIILGVIVVVLAFIYGGYFNDRDKHIRYLAQIEKGAIYETCTKKYVD